MRVSLNSAQAQFYHAYYQPQKYTFDDVIESIRIARRHKVWVSLNYLVFPGFTDHPGELRALVKLLRKTNINMIHTRNLNIDPAWYIQALGLASLRGQPIGMMAWIHSIRQTFPDVRLGYFNPTHTTMARERRGAWQRGSGGPALPMRRILDAPSLPGHRSGAGAARAGADLPAAI